MGYRNILVDDVNYKYTVGRTHVKIHGKQAVPISEIGAAVGDNRWAVTPLRVATYIKLGYIPDSTPVPNILLEESTAAMRKIAKTGEQRGDYEASHSAADDLLCKVLRKLGYEKLVDAYHQVPKWYA